MGCAPESWGAFKSLTTGESSVIDQKEQPEFVGIPGLGMEIIFPVFHTSGINNVSRSLHDIVALF